MLKDKSYKWWLLAFLFVTFFLEQGTRQIYNAALPQIRLDFLANGVTDTQLGMVGTVFSAVFGLSLVGSGLAADFFGRKRVLVLGTALFSLGVFGSGFAAGLGLMMLMYGVLNAAGQCCIAPPCYSLISQYHDRTRSVAMSIFQSAVYIGLILSSVFAGALAEMGAGGWRWAFWLMGGAGLVWALVMQLGMRDTPQPVTAAGEKPTMKAAFAALVKKPTAVLIAVAFGMFVYAQLGLRLWLPMFMVRHFQGTGIAEAAYHSVLWMSIGALVSVVVVAKIIDRLAVRRPRIKLEVSLLAFLLCIGPALLVARAESLTACCVGLTLLGATYGVYDAAHYPAMFDCVEPRYRSATTGLTGCLAFLFGSLAPTLLGWMGEHLSMRTALASLGGFYLLGALVLVPAVLFFFKRDYIGNGSESK